ncbi:uncharacterized protein LACBIDRAFT_305252 [Laccaria bicolor S238N-H82]|uniref:Predicted protein n=1 Tax=Laccaria bicolor (strain S238N-H82 / ATCC MYA-4686) TaxID=486041 RepID=B0CTT1_LACBS|nr:uncharacterized protein LACBIDRAFT_305252 [Laccaria bicolor S238N-H82]EDR14550.1 predicted protein [Laccaria bicolor S238N-H82]|eukprot:XP_001875109.1 predicted protein [Laccaria bicolor S238N-H82]
MNLFFSFWNTSYTIQLRQRSLSLNFLFASYVSLLGGMQRNLVAAEELFFAINIAYIRHCCN